ncbi:MULTISPECIES: type VI secretion system contractile sheath small subunit [Dyadobacter]|uniref:Type VI secretion system contractile sheath small subunit n=2 Tax=Dyadobacter TaxID=120831 RepID=A0A9X1PB59_9BACT|nr:MULTISPECIES: type VI secretion system contractile sheath small subunit [Dyadobacter]MCE7070796.1 type VI secretion system contractile sheath small subunit [Dyadobacter sp. CY327]MCF0040047.1 type VI secretion system contractile sheath small subunit [Dyadobacter fanqingshengii]MCF2502440.1 type VI secretion system contractile sheath small subunit [Dyadobacter fanqingshengii]MCF2518558.1 type VI secretion system contractile sheath small subunit [Dyadobacter sp. CY351]USJ38201.1 type VI secre
MAGQFDFIRPGGNVDPDANKGYEKIEALPPSRTLYVSAFNSNPEKEKVTGLETMEAVFEHFKPEVEAEFEDENGAPVFETMSFTKMKDFSPEGMLEQSPFLKELSGKEYNYDRFYKNLKNNRQLQKALSDPATRATYLSALQTLIGELKESL